MITKKNNVQPFYQQEVKNGDKIFFFKIFEGMRDCQITVFKYIFCRQLICCVFYKQICTGDKASSALTSASARL